MKFTKTTLPGALLIEPKPLRDERGFFARTFCREEMSRQGIDFSIVQCSVSFNLRCGTLRGMHWQREPKAEDKLVSCTRGSVFDVIIDLREGSPSRGRWYGVELSAKNHRIVYIPRGFAHGFQTLADEAEVYYQMSEYYSPDHADGVPWDDPAFGIVWPLPVSVMSEKDRNYPRFQP